MAALDVARGQLIVQHDGRLLLPALVPAGQTLAGELRQFAELEKCAGDYHVYRLTRYSLWNAAANGLTVEAVTGFLHAATGHALPPRLAGQIHTVMTRYGQLWLMRSADDGTLRLAGDDRSLLDTLALKLGLSGVAAAGLPVAEEQRGWVKHRLATLGYPVRDDAGYAMGQRLTLAWRADGVLRPYQQAAVAALVNDTSGQPGSGLVVLPCGAGKTLVGVGATVALGCHTLVLCPNSTAVRQWRETYAARTTLALDTIGEYTARQRELRPVTVTTYQMVTARRTARDSISPEFAHLARFMAHDWGLIVFDEAHLLPANVFRLAAGLQSRRRLGLTATPVREDGRESELFALVGPVLYNVPWGRLEAEGWIAPAICTEVRVPALWSDVAPGSGELSFREAAAAAAKWPVVRAIARRHHDTPVVVLGQYLDQLRDLAARLAAPLVSGDTPAPERERLFSRFRAGDEPVLVLSRVGNAAIDLPNAAVAIEVSGNFGSRQEEAQRLGRVLRPKQGQPAYFYTLVTEGTVEQAHAARRQRFLVEQGYDYRIVNAREWLSSAAHR